jgi:hypothetical protein
MCRALCQAIVRAIHQRHVYHNGPGDPKRSTSHVQRYQSWPPALVSTVQEVDDASTHVKNTAHDKEHGRRGRYASCSCYGASAKGPTPLSTVTRRLNLNLPGTPEIRCHSHIHTASFTWSVSNLDTLLSKPNDHYVHRHHQGTADAAAEALIPKQATRKRQQLHVLQCGQPTHTLLHIT